MRADTQVGGTFLLLNYFKFIIYWQGYKLNFSGLFTNPFFTLWKADFVF